MRQQGCGEFAEVILEKFQNTFSYGEGPDVYSHMLVLRAWEKTASKSDRRKASERAEAFFQDMEKRVKASLLPALDVNAYNVLMNCYARAGDADKAEQLLTDLQSSDQSIRPNSKSYSLVLKALANSCATNAVDRAWKVMHEVGYPSTNLSIEICNAMLKLFAKRGMASEAEEMLNKMDEIVDGKIKQDGPDIQSYEAVLEALGRCKDDNTSSRAEALVTRLEVMGELGGNLKPSLLIYNTLLNCYANGKTYISSCKYIL
jgi:pentatricopeptide repeat protein